MSDRKPFRWSVQVQAETGEVADRTVSAFWSPDHELTTESVGSAAAIAAWKKSGERAKFFPVSVTLLEEAA